MAFYRKKVKSRWHDDLSRLTWQEFERLIAEYYRAQGYEVNHVGTAATNAKADGGIDLKLYKAGKYIVVQCKHWNALQVEHNGMHELLGVMITQKADSAIIVSSGEFTAAAKRAASKTERIELIDGIALRQLLGEGTVPIRRHIYDGRDQTVEYAPRQPGSHRRNAKPRKSMLHAILIFALPLIFFFVIIKLLPSFIAMALKKPEPVNRSIEAVQVQRPLGGQIPPVRTLPVESSSAQIGSADAITF